MNEIEAAMLNKIRLELISDNLRGWRDRNPAATENDIRARADALHKLGFDELEREEDAALLLSPGPSLHIGRVPRRDTNVSTDMQPGAATSEETAWALERRQLSVHRREMTQDQTEEERRDHDRLCMAIGRFMFKFSQLEFYIRDALKFALGLEDEKFHIVASYEFAALCNVTKESFRRFVKHALQEQKVIDRLLVRCLEINHTRVAIAHGTWFQDETGVGVEFVKRGSAVPKVQYEEIAELEHTAQKIEELQSDVVRLLIWPFQWQTRK